MHLSYEEKTEQVGSPKLQTHLNINSATPAVYTSCKSTFRVSRVKGNYRVACFQCRRIPEDDLFVIMQAEWAGRSTRASWIWSKHENLREQLEKHNVPKTWINMLNDTYWDNQQSPTTPK